MLCERLCQIFEWIVSGCILVNDFWELFEGGWYCLTFDLNDSKPEFISVGGEHWHWSMTVVAQSETDMENIVWKIH